MEDRLSLAPRDKGTMSNPDTEEAGPVQNLLGKGAESWPLTPTPPPGGFLEFHPRFRDPIMHPLF